LQQNVWLWRVTTHEQKTRRTEAAPMAKTAVTIDPTVTVT